MRQQRLVQLAQFAVPSALYDLLAELLLEDEYILGRKPTTEKPPGIVSRVVAVVPLGLQLLLV